MRPTELILEILGKEGSGTARELVERVISQDSSRSEEEILDTIEELNRSGRIALRPPRFKGFRGFFMTLHWNTAFWTVIALCTVYAAVYAVPVGFPWSLVRVPVGLLLLSYLPGHSFLKIFLGKYASLVLERYILEICMSIFLMLMVGLLLNFTLFGLLATPALAAVLGLNIILAGSASYDDYRNFHSKKS